MMLKKIASCLLFFRKKTKFATHFTSRFIYTFNIIKK